MLAVRNRVELWGDVGYLIFDPSWGAVTWRFPEVSDVEPWVGAPPPESFFTCGTPSVPVPQDARPLPERPTMVR
jgi:hypothetical protein